MLKLLDYHLNTIIYIIPKFNVVILGIYNLRNGFNEVIKLWPIK